MIWLLPLLIIGIVFGRERIDDDERMFRERQLAQEKAKLRAEQEARAKADTAAVAAKQLGQQYLAMKPTIAGNQHRHPRRRPRPAASMMGSNLWAHRANLDLNGEDPSKL